MTVTFSVAELAWLHDETRRLARVATADQAAHPHVTPVGMWRHDPETDTIDVTGRQFASTKKFRNVAENPWAALVIDDIASTDPWRPRAITIQGPAQALTDPDRPGEGRIRITPEQVTSWGLGSEQPDR